MKALLDRLRERAVTLTVYNYEGSDEDLETLAASFSSSGVAVTTDTPQGDTPANLGVFHRGDDVFGAVSLDEQVAPTDFGAVLAGEQSHDRSAIPELPGDSLTVSPETSRERMVGISRTFERRALREGGGRLIAGFQTLSTLAGSERTRSVYERLADANVDVTVCGYPDVQLDETPEFDIFADTDERFREYWFLLYDGNGTDERKAALVSKEADPSLYDSFWTSDPDTVDELFTVVAETYPELD